ncbi:hypothetical protein DNTS_003836 [Danionella cerebrum]|uniref:Myb-like domain-containing protein n=1 Tax=Danionella cerebrum TaxID=2873325 RepID=A0A553QZB0_9TELE|nr:hypothetical protein DNTS_003836 [Danionella translucida]
MMRRARISVRPNVKPSGRALAASSKTSAENIQASQDPGDSIPSQGAEVTVEKLQKPAEGQTTVETPQSSTQNKQPVNTTCGEDAASTSSKAQESSSLGNSGLQRRKRFTALPNLAKPRVPPVSTRTPKSPVKPLAPKEPDKSIPASGSSLHAPEPVNTPQVPGKGKLSGGYGEVKAQPIPFETEQELQNDGGNKECVIQIDGPGSGASDSVLVDQNSSECPVLSAKEDVVEQQDSRPVLGQNQIHLLREKLLKLKSPSKFLRSIRSLNDPADMVRLAQARKLRDLLKKEIKKDKEHKKKPKFLKEHKAPKDHTKMTMRELIYYLPVSNPMKSITEQEQTASETILEDTLTPDSSETPATPPVQETAPEETADREEEEVTEENQPEEEEPLLVPRVKVAEDGSLIIDEESLTVRVSRTKGPNPAEDRDPIFERGSTTTYSSFRKGTYTKPWSNGETDMFFLAISMVGTDFSMIGQLFPHRARLEIKNKFKKEERYNTWRIDKAFSKCSLEEEKRRLDLDFFKKLMDHVLKDEEIKRNRNKELTRLAQSRKRLQWKARVTRRKEIYSSEDSESDSVAGEKENEDLSKGASDFPAKEWKERSDKSKKTDGEDQPEDCEGVSSDLQSQEDRLKASDSSENINKSSAIKPAQLKGRPQRHVPNISRQWGERRPLPRSCSLEDDDAFRNAKGNRVSSQPGREEEENHGLFIVDLDDFDDEPDLSAVQQQIFNKPTRSGRIPKLSQHVMQAAAEEDEENEEDFSASSKVCVNPIQAPRRAKTKTGPRLKQGIPRRGKSKLVTLLAAGTEDDEEEEQDNLENCILVEDDYHPNAEEENQVFVPMSLRPQLPANSEVVETMEELDISVNMPEILGTSQNPLCQAYEYEQAELPAGHVPCEHQLDLLIDVIEYLDPAHMEVCNQINNEAAETLLTIGNTAQASEMHFTGGKALNEVVVEVHEEVITETAILSRNEDIKEVHEDVFLETSILSGKDTNEDAMGIHGVTETNITSVCCDPEMKRDIELSSYESHVSEIAVEELSNLKEKLVKSQKTTFETVQCKSQDLAPPTKRGRFSKPKPNIGQSLRTRQAPPQLISSQTLTDSLQALNEAEGDKKEVHLTQVDITSPSNTIIIHPEVLQPCKYTETRDSYPTDIPERVAEEDNGCGSPLKRNNDGAVTEEKASAQEETKSCSELTNSVPVPQKIKETSMRIISAQSLEEVAAVSPESSVPQHAAQELTTRVDSIQMVQDATPKVVSEDESRQETVVLDEDEGTNTLEEVLEDSIVRSSRSESTDALEESVFILSLTEIPPTSGEAVGLIAELLPPATVSESQSYEQSVDDNKDVSHLLISDALVPVEEDEDNTQRNEVENWQLQVATTSISPERTGAQENEGQLFVKFGESALAEVPVEELVGITRKAPERTRRAKLQVKPSPVSRRSSRGTASSLNQQTTSLHTSTPEMRSEQSVSVPLSTSTIVLDREMVNDESVQESTIVASGVCPEVEPVEVASGLNTQRQAEITSGSQSGTIERPGRRPKGFLSFISSKSTQVPSAGHRGSRPAPQKPVVNTARPERKRPADTSMNPAPKRPSPTPAATSEISEGEPTSVFKYLFSDIFTEVEELEDTE